MECGQGGGQSFVISGQATAARCPGKAALDDPSSREQHESAFGFGMLNHFQLNAVLFRGLGGVFAGIALIDIGQFHMFAGDLLYRFGQRLNLTRSCSSADVT